MDQGILNCQHEGHQDKQIELLCTFQDCELDNRYLCSLCIFEDVHRHGQISNNHIKSFEKLDGRLKEIIIDVKQQVIQNHHTYKDKLLHLKQLILEMQEQLQSVLLQINDYEVNPLSKEDEWRLNELMIKIQQPFYYLNEQCIRDIMSLDQYEFNKQRNQQLQDSIQLIQLRLMDMQKNGIGFFSIQPYQTLYIYQSKTILKLKKHKIYTVQLSNDQKYIVAGGTQRYLQIWNADNLKQTRHNIQLQKSESVFIIKFTDDSSIMNIGTQYGNVYQFDVNNDFKKINFIQIHNHAVLNIYCVTNSILISCCGNGNIIKFDYPAKQQLLEIKAHGDRIDGLDFDPIRNLIVSGSSDKTIKVWDGNGKLVIANPEAAVDEIKQNAISITRFIRNQDKIISLDTGHHVTIWKMDFQQNCLEIHLRFTDYYIITSFTMVLQDQYLLLVCKQYLKIYSIKGQYIGTIQHNVQDFMLSNTIQDQTLKTILVKGQNQLQIFKAIL